MNIAVEDVMRIIKERRAINQLDFMEIIWTYQGEAVDIPEGAREKFLFTGLSNMDFITSNFLKDRPWQKE